jgi:SulP family sulfate permease
MLAAFPSAIAYGVMVFAVLGFDAQGALFGMIGAVALGILAPLVGGAPRLISGPCGPAALLLQAFALQMLAQRDPSIEEDAWRGIVVVLIGLVAILTAALQFGYGAVGGGRLIKYIPYPVVAGYLSGVGIYMFWAQLPKAFGLPRPEEMAAALALPRGVHAGTWDGLRHPGEFWSLPPIVVAAVTAAGMLLAPRITKKVPAVILGLASGVAAYFALGFFRPELWSLVSADGHRNPFVVGAVGGGGGGFLSGLGDRWDALGGLTGAQVGLAVVPALTLSVLLSIDTLKTCVIVDALTRARHDSNRVLIGQGIGNFASALAGGMPGAGQMGPTLVNFNSGGTTRLSGVLEGLFCLLAFLLLGPFLSWLPHAALAGILLVISFRMVDRHSLDLLRHRSTRLDFCVVAAVVVTAVTTSPIAAAGVGLALAILLFMREQIHVSVVRHKVRGNQVSSKKDRLPEEMAVLQREGGQTTVCELQGTLFFGTTDQLVSILAEDVKTCRYLLLDLRRVQSLDYTAAHMLEQLEASLTDRGAHLVFSSLPASLPSGQDLRTYFDQLGLVKREHNVKVFDDEDAALEWIEDRVLEAAGVRGAGEGRALDLAEFDLFREFDAGSIRLLREAMEERTVARGQRVFAQGEPGSELFLIRRGTIHILLPLPDGRHHHLATFGRGSFFGDMAFLDKGIRSANATAVDGEVDLYVLSRERFDALSRGNPATGAMLFARLAKILALRLRRTDAELQAMEAS